MARWPKLDKKQHEELRRFAVTSVLGTMLPGDGPLIGKQELVAHFEEFGAGGAGLGVSQAYAAANTMASQDWALKHSGHAVTMQSSADNYIERIEPAKNTAVRASIPWAQYGGMAPKVGSRPRGRPKKS